MIGEFPIGQRPIAGPIDPTAGGNVTVTATVISIAASVPTQGVSVEQNVTATATVITLTASIPAGVPSYTDNFNRSDEVPLSGGGVWTQTGYDVGNYDNYMPNLISNQVQSHSDYAYGLAIYNRPVTKSQYVQFKITGGTMTSPAIGALMRANLTTLSHYEALYYGGQWNLWHYVDDDWVGSESFQHLDDTNPAVNDTIRIEAEDRSDRCIIRVFVNNKLVAYHEDTTYYADIDGEYTVFYAGDYKNYGVTVDDWACGPLNVASDNFNRASLGSDWNVVDGGVTIASNQAIGTTDTENAAEYVGAEFASADYAIEITYRTTGTGQDIGLAFRIGATQYYVASVYGSGFYFGYVTIDTGWTNIETAGTTFNDGDRLYVRVKGSDIRLYRINSSNNQATLINTDYTDSTLTTGGPGIYLYDNDSGSTLDNFYVTNKVAASGATVSGDAVAVATVISIAASIQAPTVSAAGSPNATAPATVISVTASVPTQTATVGAVVAVAVVEMGVVIGTNRFDAYDRANQNPIGSPWSQWNSAAQAQLLDGSAQCVGANSYGYGKLADSLAEDTWAETEQSGTTIEYTGPMVRGNASGCYMAELYGDDRVYIERHNASGGWVADIASWAVTRTLPNRIRLEVEGTTLRCWYNGAYLGSTTDGNITGEGYAGFEVSNTGVTKLDKWRGGSLRAGNTVHGDALVVATPATLTAAVQGPTVAVAVGVVVAATVVTAAATAQDVVVIATSPNATAIATVISVTATVQAPTYSMGARPVPTALSVVATAQSAASVNVGVKPLATVAGATFSVQAPAVIAGGTVVVPTTVCGVVASVQAPTVKNGSVFAVTAVTFTATAQGPTVRIGARPQPTACSVTVAAQAPSVRTAARATPAAISLVLAIYGPNVRCPALALPGVISMAAGAQIVAIRTGVGAVAGPALLGTYVPQVVVVVAGTTTVLPDVISLLLNVQTPAKVVKVAGPLTASRQRIHALCERAIDADARRGMWHDSRRGADVDTRKNVWADTRRTIDAEV